MKSHKLETKIGPRAETKVVNPFATKIIAAAGRQAATEKRLSEAQDELWLSNADLNALTREISAADILESGPAISAATARRYERAVARREQAEGEYQGIEEKAREARGALFTLQKASQKWEEQEAHLARQVEAEKALTASERERRQYLALAAKYDR
jgi:hypothetical protein